MLSCMCQFSVSCDGSQSLPAKPAGYEFSLVCTARRLTWSRPVRLQLSVAEKDYLSRASEWELGLNGREEE